MSLTVRKVLELPSMKGASVVAGANALERTVSSVSVLEYSTPNDTQSKLFKAINFEGNELVITAFASICDSPQAQKAVIRRLAEAGEVGLLLYYVGTFIPFIAEDVIETANSLNFVLVEMPHSMSLRYSDAISEISEAILKEEDKGSSFVTEILEDVSLLSPDLRSVSTVINISTFPHGRESEMKKCFETNSMDPSWYVNRAYIQGKGLKTLCLTFIRENGTPLEHHQIAMTVETLHLFLVIWSPNHGEAVIAELVRAILQDESLKMRRLAAMFNIDVKSLDTMYVIHSRKNTENVMKEIRQKLTPFISRPVVDLYEGNIVLFLASGMGSELLESICTLLSDENCFLIRAFNLKDTSDVRKAFLEITPSLELACRAYRKNVLNLSDIQLINYFLQVIEKGEDEISKVLSPLKVLEETEDADLLMQTLEAFILDTDLSTLKTSKLINVHNNTVKYRIRRISSLMHADITKAPQSIMLYRAMMMRRILGLQGSG